VGGSYKEAETPAQRNFVRWPNWPGIGSSWLTSTLSPVVRNELVPLKPTTKIRFTEPQIALVLRAYPNCNLGHLTELSFEFDQNGKITDCIGTIKDRENMDHNYAGGWLARLC
jgi:hypothetical protein